ncbi:MAG: glycosyltransferase [Paludibacteraceae bacterium]|nr:glycosyltransferase [Paludibacteraceae bacterium]MBQ6984016.1 glycosyltransferase [Paludibacteraceae bacterium]
MNKPLVYIECQAYNHAGYIAKCLDGIVMQKTNFQFVAIVHDDASQDETPTIIAAYAEKYPDIIKPILSKENKYSQGILDDFMHEQCQDAKYVAICEGDDYWTDPYKLQQQIDILEADETLMLCCTDCSVVDNHGEILKPQRGGVVKNGITGRYNLRDFFRDNHQYPTLTVVYRNNHPSEVRMMIEQTKNQFLSDWTQWIILMTFGDAYFIDEVTGAYRINPTSVTHTVNRVARAKASVDICKKVADVLPEQYADIAADLRDTRWVWVSLIFAYRAEKRYLGMIGSIIMACIMCPGSLWRTVCRHKGRRNKV